MARGAASRTQPSQSQSQSQTQPRNAPRPSQSQRARRAPTEDEDEDEDEDLGEEYGEAMEQDDEAGDDDITRKAHALVRLALFNEQRRVPLRRDEISKKVLGSKSRQFNEVLSVAQTILRQTFGMEMFELQPLAEEPAPAPVDGADKAKGRKKAPTGTKTYILRSTLHPDLIERAAAQDGALFMLEQQERAGAGDDADDGDEGAPPGTGALLAWQAADQLGGVGILHVVLALILVNGKAILENDLRRLLKRLRLHAHAIVPLSSLATHTSTSVDAFLTQCLKQGFLTRVRVGEARAASKKRARVQLASQSAGAQDEDVWEWRWGPRAGAEVGERAVARFVAEFMVESAPRGMYGEGDSEDEEKNEAVRQRGMKESREKMLTGIERAAGGTLFDIA